MGKLRKPITFGDPCSCKELKKPDHPYEVEVKLNCPYCNKAMSEVIWYHSQNWLLANPTVCGSCNTIIHKVEHISDKITALFLLIRRLYVKLK